MMSYLWFHLFAGLSRAGDVARLFAYGVVIMLVWACSPAEPPLRLASHPWPGYDSLHLARSLGYYDGVNLRQVQMVSATQVSNALRNGTVDAATLTLDEVLALMQDGIDLRVVLVMDISQGADVVLARPEITGIKALRGKRVGVEVTAVGAVMLSAMLEQAGMTVGDIQLVPLAVNEHAAAYRDGNVDAVITFDPARNAILKEGAVEIFNSRQIPGRIVDVLVVRAEALSRHAETLKQVVAGHFHALDYLSTHPEDAAARIAPLLNVASGDVLPQYQGMTLPALAQNREMLGGASPALIKGATELTRIMLQNRLLRRSVAVERLADAGYLP